MSKTSFNYLIHISIICLSFIHFATGAKCMYALNQWQHIPFKRIQSFYNFIFQLLGVMYLFVGVFSVLVALYSLITSFLACKKGVKMLNMQFYLNLFSFSFQFFLGVTSVINLIIFQQNLHVLINLVDFWNILESLLICQAFVTLSISMPLMVFAIYSRWKAISQQIKDKRKEFLSTQIQLEIKDKDSNENKAKNQLCWTQIEQYVSSEPYFGVNYPLKTKIICFSVLLINAILHIAFGIQFLEQGYSSALVNQNQQLYLNSVPLGSFSITVGIYLILSITFFSYQLTKSYHFAKIVEHISWHVSWPIFVCNFAVGVILIGQYFTTLEIYKIFELNAFQSSSSFQAQYYISVADGTFTLLLGLPTTFIIMHYANCRFLANQIKGDVKIVAQNINQSNYLPLCEELLGSINAKTFYQQKQKCQNREVSQANLNNVSNDKL